MKVTSIAVTGANGFIGRHISNALCDGPSQVRGLMGPFESTTDSIRHDVANMSFIEGDINDEQLLAKLLEGVDAVVHLAGPPSVAESFRNPAKFLRVHAEGTASVLRVMTNLKIRKLVYISSAEVYGQPSSDLVGESHPIQARSPYGAAKIAAEQLIQAMAPAANIDATILRPFSIYGPGQSRASLFSTILSKVGAIDSEGTIELWDLAPVRDYCFVGDLARAVLLALESEKAGVSTCNIGTSIGTSVGELASMVVACAGKKVQVRDSVGHQRPPKSEIYSLVADRRLAKEILNWEPDVTLSDGIAATVSAEEIPA